jgi:hypothetical protein
MRFCCQKMQARYQKVKGVMIIWVELWYYIYTWKSQKLQMN